MDWKLNEMPVGRGDSRSQVSASNGAGWRPPDTENDSFSVPPPPKPLVRRPTTVGDFCRGFFLDLCRLHFRFPVRHKAVALFCVVSVLAFHSASRRMTTRVPAFAHKGNFFNVIFVKWGWAWTLVALGPFIWLTASVYSLGRQMDVLRHLSRLGVGHFVWWFVVGFFARVQRATRHCSVGNGTIFSETFCMAKGGRFSSIDLSGHCFLIIYSLLLIAEEARVYRHWARLLQRLESRIQRGDGPAAVWAPGIRLFHQYTPWIELWLGLFLCCLSLIWYYCLVITSLYYHTFVHKEIGCVVAIAMWYLTYHVWYPSRGLSPPLPGRGYVIYQE